MNKAAESVKNTVEMALLERSRPTDDELRNLVKGIAKAVAPNLDDVEIEDVKFEDGLLTITLIKNLPEKQKRKKWF